MLRSTMFYKLNAFSTPMFSVEKKYKRMLNNKNEKNQ